MYRRKRSQQERKSKTEKKEQKRTEKNGMLSLRTGRYFCYKKDQIPRIFYGVRYSAFLMTAVR